jgi:hypothetical protein
MQRPRGMFYYRGRTTPIDFNAIGELASEVAVNIVIEKEGVPAVLAPYADKYRVALISTQGRFVDYVKRFVSSVIDEAAVVVTILDDDRVGREMAKSTRAINLYGIGKLSLPISLIACQYLTMGILLINHKTFCNIINNLFLTLLFIIWQFV